MKRSGVKKIVFGKILPVACSLTLTGCITNLTDSITEKKEEKNPIEETKITEEEIPDINLECAIDDQGIFFEKVSPNELVYLDDIILTNSERGIDSTYTYSLERDLFDSIKYSWLDAEEKEIIDKLKVRDLAEETFTSSVATEYIEKHTHTALYVEDKNDLNWEQLFSVLKNNAILKRKGLEAEIENAHTEKEKERLQELVAVRDFTDEELEDWIRQFHTFLTETRELYSVDMRRLACILEDYVVGYEHQSLALYGTLARTSDEQMSYPLFEGRYPNLAKFQHINYHEFFHLLDSTCVDEKKEVGTFFGLGIEFDEEYISNLGEYQDEDYFPFGYEFIEEGKAESYSSNLLNEEPTTFYDKQFTINNIELALFLQPGFERGNLEKAAILHNPIALIQQFPVLDGLISEEENWFYTQLEMLESYNVINDQLSLFEFYSDVYGEDEAKVDETIRKRVTVLENYADLQLFRNFVWNLINSKNTERAALSLEDYYYLMNLFIERIEVQRKIVCFNYDIESLDTVSYLKDRENIIDLFEENIKDKYSNLEFREIGSFEDYNLNEGRLSSAFTSRERTYFYKLYREMDDYYKWNKEFKNNTRNIKTYYLEH